MVTPLRGVDELDVPGLERVIERLISGRVRGLFILGTTGEGPSLSYRLRRELIERTCRQVAGRVPVLVGISDTAFVECLGISNYSAECGAAAVVAAPPYYLPESQPELLEWIGDLHDALPLPLMLYNMPALTKVVIEVETVRRAMEFENIVGLKDSSGDLEYFRSVIALRAQRPDWSVLIGPEEKLAEADAAGGDGGVCGGANIFPRMYVGLHEAAMSEDVTRVVELRRLVLLASERIYGVGLHASRIIKGIKCALSCLGDCEDFMAAPFRAFRDPERRKVAEAVEAVSAELRRAGVL